MTSIVPHQALYRRWRAQTFSQIVGQDAVVEVLRNAVRSDRVAHAMLFVGPRGTGKTSLARIVAKAVNCTNLQDGDPCDACDACVAIREGTTLDVLEIDAASNRGINEVRELRERLAYPPGHLRRKVYILDEAHQITRDAWNALLKSIEEPPDFVLFMFASTEPSGFPPAILSRLQRFDVRRLSVGQIEGKLTRILEADGRSADPAALALIARLAAGGMRDAESMLDQLLATSADPINEAQVRDLLGLAEVAAVEDFLDALLTGDAPAGIAVIDGLEERGRDLRAFLDQVVDALRGRFADPAATDRARLAEVGRKLVAIDIDRAAIGGLRLQLELALFSGPPGGRRPAAAPEAAVRSTPPTTASMPDATSAPSPSSSAGAAPSEPKPADDRAASDPAQGAPVSEPAPQRSAAAIADPLDDDLGRVVRDWTEFVRSVGPATRAVLSECRPIGVEGNIVTLGFPESKGFLRDHAERRRAEIEAAVGGLLGRPVSVRAVATNIEVAPLASDDLVAEARRIFGDDLVDVGEVT